MSAQERTGTRNLALSAWRRWPNMPHRFTAIDIDLLGYCSYCHAPLFLIEAVEGSIERKATYVIERLAASLWRPIPVAVIGYRTGADGQLAGLDGVIKSTVAGKPHLTEIHGPRQWVQWETRTRYQHDRDCEANL